MKRVMSAGLLRFKFPVTLISIVVLVIIVSTVGLAMGLYVRDTHPPSWFAAAAAVFGFGNYVLGLLVRGLR